MYWINLSKLEKQLKSNRLSDSNALTYPIVNVVVATLVIYTLDEFSVVPYIGCFFLSLNLVPSSFASTSSQQRTIKLYL